MSNLWVNIRFGCRHLQVSRDGISFKINLYHLVDKPDEWFKVYKFFKFESE